MTKRSEEILVGADDAAAFLGWHVNTLRKYAAKYPPGGAGFPAHLNGRWNVNKADLLAWRDYVLRQESRHPESRLCRPEEPPSVADIRGRPARGFSARGAAPSEGDE